MAIVHKGNHIANNTLYDNLLCYEKHSSSDDNEVSLSTPPILHDDNPEMHQHYNDFVEKHRMTVPQDYVPRLMTLEGGHTRYVVWNINGKEYSASAWNDTIQVQGVSWVDPAAAREKLSQPPHHIDDGDNGRPPRNRRRTRLEEHIDRQPFEQLEDNHHYVAYSTWFQGNYGHLASDYLPTLAYLVRQHYYTSNFVIGGGVDTPKNNSSSSNSSSNNNNNNKQKTKFLLLYRPVLAQLLEYIDPFFVEEHVIFVRLGREYRLGRNSHLTVVLPRSIPDVASLRMASMLREWLLPSRLETLNQPLPPNDKELRGRKKKKRDLNNDYDGEDKDDETTRLVIYYSRGGSTDTHHGRKIEPHHEEEILQLLEERIRQKNEMNRHSNKPKLKLVVFTGQTQGNNNNVKDHDTRRRTGLANKVAAVAGGRGGATTMSIENQAALFGRAHTVIGPHGTGLGGNLLWCPCDTTLVEFVPGPASAGVVHHLYASHYWHFHNLVATHHHHLLLYTPQSTHETTYIDLAQLDRTLNTVWSLLPTTPPPPTTTIAGTASAASLLESATTRIDR